MICSMISSLNDVRLTGRIFELGVFERICRFMDNSNLSVAFTGPLLKHNEHDGESGYYTLPSH
jgi:hypothetical protein